LLRTVAEITPACTLANGLPWVSRPKATEAEIQLLLDAEQKNGGSPPDGLAHARTILADNVWIFKPRPWSPFGRNRDDGKYFPTQPAQWQLAAKVQKPDYTSIFLSELAWAQKYWTANWDDTELALHASMSRALETIHTILSKPPDNVKPAG
jgi:hypothetical protein